MFRGGPEHEERTTLFPSPSLGQITFLTRNRLNLVNLARGLTKRSKQKQKTIKSKNKSRHVTFPKYYKFKRQRK